MSIILKKRCPWSITASRRCKIKIAMKYLHTFRVTQNDFLEILEDYPELTTSCNQVFKSNLHRIQSILYKFLTINAKEESELELLQFFKNEQLQVDYDKEEYQKELFSS